MEHKYKITAELTAEEAANITPESSVAVKLADTESSFNFLIQSIERSPSGIRIVLDDFKKLIKALAILFKGSAAKMRLLSISLVYLSLTPSSISMFFIRGWRMGIISRMTSQNSKFGIAPPVDSLTQIGYFIKEGIKLVIARFVYDFPKILILVMVGYDYASLIVDLGYYFFTSLFDFNNEGEPQSLRSVVEGSSVKLTNGFIASLIFYVLYSVIVTPAFKIMEIKYAVKSISYRSFFSLGELFKSFRLYRKYRSTTLEMYFWDVLVSTISLLIGLLLFTTLPILIIFHPLWKLPFNHWTKSYGYGLLARRLIANNELKIVSTIDDFL
ncbi:hypothetical protein [Haliscomenobacter hydrossis]|uniref:Uncharacterized protein n=1 Tax=Haliscomenobacter hydrossis (strain ATCC 27775 / DSM 1100 / LMG 10767 / O) TaxID=760192 RepID=F4L2G5_HALH1|nr:hypothetical protein [Haliscomenobacter hydrossis]AEE53883.1 hypothetical protein Halhy_6061 [Haliscomenobacter hydrossis DSM 1100]